MAGRKGRPASRRERTDRHANRQEKQKQKGETEMPTDRQER